MGRRQTSKPGKAHLLGGLLKAPLPIPFPIRNACRSVGQEIQETVVVEIRDGEARGLGSQEERRWVTAAAQLEVKLRLLARRGIGQVLASVTVEIPGGEGSRRISRLGFQGEARLSPGHQNPWVGALPRIGRRGFPEFP